MVILQVIILHLFLWLDSVIQSFVFPYHSWHPEDFCNLVHILNRSVLWVEKEPNTKANPHQGCQITLEIIYMTN